MGNVRSPLSLFLTIRAFKSSPILLAFLFLQYRHLRLALARLTRRTRPPRRSRLGRRRYRQHHYQSSASLSLPQVQDQGLLFHGSGSQAGLNSSPNRRHQLDERGSSRQVCEVEPEVGGNPLGYPVSSKADGLVEARVESEGGEGTPALTSPLRPLFSSPLFIALSTRLKCQQRSNSSLSTRTSSRRETSRSSERSTISGCVLFPFSTRLVLLSARRPKRGS